ncbi:MAG: DMT family transporter [Desulfuromonadales bacterium]|nr:DMT family transporter [Desulfuromonadales bacterium]
MSGTAPLWQIYMKLALAAVFWGGTFISGKLLAAEVAPFTAAFLRFALATLLLLILTRRYFGRLPGINGDDLVPLLLLGLSGVFAYNALFFSGLMWIEASRAAVIIANNPVMIALGAALFYGESLTLKKFVGIGLSVIGAVTVVVRGDLGQILSGGVGWGELMIFGCVLSWTTYSLVGRRVMRHFSPLVAVTYSAAIGTFLLFPFALLEGMSTRLSGISVVAWGHIGYLALFGTVLGFVWYYQGIVRIGSTRAGQFINIVPLTAVCLSILLLGEPLTWSLLVGLMFVSGGLYLTNK